MANSKTVDKEISKTVDSIDDFEFIDAYKTHPCLYNTSLTLYKNRYAKDAAYENLSQKFSVSVDTVKTRIHRLRAKYGKIKQPGRSGSAGIRLSSQHQRLLEALSFLKDHLKPRNSLTNLPLKSATEEAEASSEDETPADERPPSSECTTQASTIQSESNAENAPISASTLNSGKRKRATEESQFLNSAKAFMDDMRGSKRSEPSAEDHFANYISAELLLISNTLLREQTKMKIQQVLYDTKVALISSTGIATAILPSPSVTTAAASVAAPRSDAVTTSAMLSPSTVVYSSAAASSLPCHTAVVSRDLLPPCSTATNVTKPVRHASNTQPAPHKQQLTASAPSNHYAYHSDYMPDFLPYYQASNMQAAIPEYSDGANHYWSM